MKIVKTISVMALSLTLLNTQAQNDVPQGYSKGTIVLADGSSLAGYLKDNIRKDASVSLYNVSDKQTREYDGSNLNAVQIDDNKFLCIRGDFFKLVSEGELCFLQKSSDASNKTVYNGLENAFINGTEGKPGDYFIYNSSNHQLKKVSKKNVDEIAGSFFAGCNAAIEKAKSTNGDIVKVKDAVEIFNSRAKK